jgi:hypothetical protein
MIDSAFVLSLAWAQTSHGLNHNQGGVRVELPEFRGWRRLPIHDYVHFRGVSIGVLYIIQPQHQFPLTAQTGDFAHHTASEALAAQGLSTPLPTGLPLLDRPCEAVGCLVRWGTVADYREVLSSWGPLDAQLYFLPPIDPPDPTLLNGWHLVGDPLSVGVPINRHKVLSHFCW